MTIPQEKAENEEEQENEEEEKSKLSAVHKTPRGLWDVCTMKKCGRNREVCDEEHCYMESVADSHVG